MVGAVKELMRMAPHVEWHVVAAWHTDYTQFFAGLDAAGHVAGRALRLRPSSLWPPVQTMPRKYVHLTKPCTCGRTWLSETVT